ncbi:MAG: septum formation initiator [Flavobacteriales bacterium]|nr:septum formation initiator [Flavobacteriales bacterium]|tara:strand:+ start:1590 stop:1877 length:288 start_codon:yes stop_codon:yes gene_type:complete
MRFIDNIPAVFKNRYFITGTLFLIWISFFDHYNFLFHSELVQQKKELKKELNRLKKETTKNKIFLRNMNNDEFMEKYAREHYLMKKKGEDIFMLD